MPRVREGRPSKERRARKVIDAADIAAIKRAAAAANSVPALREQVTQLVEIVGRLAEAVGLEPIVE